MGKIIFAILFIASFAINGLAFADSTPSKPYVVIFKGKTICDGCETPFITIFQNRGFDVKLVQPGESTPQLLSGATVYITPGGDDVTDLKDAWTDGDRQAIRNFVQNGGRYYGACLGAYWAGKEGTWPGVIPGFKSLDMIPATVLELSANDIRAKIVDIHWDGLPRKAYFEDGPSFSITDPSRILKIYATYDDIHYVSTFMSRFGNGKVAVSGVHLEATQDWYDDDKLAAPPGLNQDLMNEILADLLD